MRSFLVCLSIFAGSLSYSQTANYRVIIAGQQLGMAKLTHTLMTDGGLTTKFEMKLSANGQSIGMNSTDTVRADGTPVKSFTSQDMPQGRETISLEYGKSGVVVKKTLNGKVTTKTIEYPKGSIKSVADFWFIKITPKIGATDTSMAFRAKDLKWEKSDDRYVGKKNITVKAKTVSAHCVTSRVADLYTDSKGLPYRVVLKQGGNEIILERS